jgi:hypothetical protein
MTLVSLPAPIPFPGILGNISNTVTVGNQTALTASGHYQAYVFEARENMTISHVAFRFGSVTSTPTIDVRIETVANTGIPSGTLWNLNGTGAAPNGSQAVVANTSYVLALTDSAVILKGEVFAVKLNNTTANSATPQAINSVAMPYTGNFPYQVVNTGTPTKSALSNAMIGLGSSSTSFYHVWGAIPPISYSAGTFNNTNSAKRGLRFTIPMNCRAVGLRWFSSTGVGDYNAVLYNDAGTELSSSSTAFDGDYSAAAQACSIVYFDNTVSLTAGTIYRIVIEPTSATNVNVSTYTFTQTTASLLTGSPAHGLTNTHYTTFASSAWDDTNTTVLPLMDLIIDQIDNGSGTGGVVGVIGG